MSASSDTGGTGAVIVDIGSGFLKAGFQSDAAPRVILPTLVGRPRRRYAHEFEGSPAFVGATAIEKRAQLSFNYPVDHGHIHDWLDFEALMEEILVRSLGMYSPKSLLLTEPPLSSSAHRNRLVELALEMFNFEETCLSLQGVMALYASGRSTGLVAEVGDGVTQIVPVNDGFVDRASIRRSDFGGQELTLYLQKLLCDRGFQVTTRDDLEHVRQIKEQLCYVSLDPMVEEHQALNMSSDATGPDGAPLLQKYDLPDGLTLRSGETSVDVSVERFYCPEALFEPRVMQRDNPSITDLVWQSVQASPIETRKAALGSVICSGGSTLFPGFPERLELELKRIAPPQARNCVKVHAADDRLFGVWNGSKLFCSPNMRAMQDLLWITKDDWLEEGPAVVARKTAFR